MAAYNPTKEYEMLRTEINECYRYMQTNDSISYTVTAAILAFAFKEAAGNVLVCLLPLFIIIPLHFKNNLLRRNVSNHAAYIRVFLEGGDFNWERRRLILRSLHEGSNSKANFLRYYMLVVLCGLAACCQIFMGHRDYEALQYIGVISLCTIVIIGIRLTCVDYGQQGDLDAEDWKKVKAIEESNHKVPNTQSSSNVPEPAPGDMNPGSQSVIK